MVPTRNRDEYLVVPEAKSDTQTRTGLQKLARNHKVNKGDFRSCEQIP